MDENKDKGAGFEDLKPELVEPVEKPKLKDTILMIVKPFIVGIIIATAFLGIANMLGYHILRINGNSMRNTYHDGQSVVLKSVPPKRHEVIIFTPPSEWAEFSATHNENSLYIKRIVAMPGDKLSIENGKVSVNGKLFRRIGKAHPAYKTSLNLTIPKDKYFVMGDNYLHSNDSLNIWGERGDDFLVDGSTVKFTAKGAPMDGKNS